MERKILVGFGTSGVTADGEHIWQESANDDWDKAPSVEDIEKVASKAPERDWRIYFYAPLYEAEYQRQGDRHWVLIKSGEGFA